MRRYTPSTVKILEMGAKKRKIAAARTLETNGSIRIKRRSQEGDLRTRGFIEARAVLREVPSNEIEILNEIIGRNRPASCIKSTAMIYPRHAVGNLGQVFDGSPKT